MTIDSIQLNNVHPKPFSPACEENKEVILQSIEPLFKNRLSVLEIASGTGQHAVYFAKNMPHLTWHTSDLLNAHSGIDRWIFEAQLSNIVRPITLDISKDKVPNTQFDAIYTANSFHIMNSQNVSDFFTKLPAVLNQTGLVVVYGPFNYNNTFTSASNARFNDWLKSNNPESGIKDFEWCNTLANKAGLTLIDDIEMPQNNRILVWQKN
ncbi:class I SAM-dependent methyltransferase [Thiomicrorhabdus hydrogeniphila]